MKNIKCKLRGIRCLLRVRFLLILCIQITPVYSIMNEVNHSRVILGPEIQVDMPVTDFGDVPVGTSKTLICTIKNNGDSNLRINSISFTGNGKEYFQVNPNEFPIQLSPNGFITAEIIFTPTAVMDWSLDVTLNITSNATYFQLHLKGRGIKPKLITVKPDTINFGNVPVESTKTESFNIINKSNDDFNYEITFRDGAFFTLAPGYVNSGKVLMNDTSSFSIQFSPQKDQNYSDILSIKGDAGVSIEINISLKGKGTVPKMSVIPDTLNFKQVVKSSSKVDSFSIFNTGLAPLKIDSIKLPPDSTFKLKEKIQFPLIVEPDNQKTISVIFFPDRVGSFNKLLYIYNNDPKKSIYKYYLKGVGILGPIIHVSQNKIDFGDIPINESKKDTVIIKNTGDKDLIIKQIEEPDATVFKIIKKPPSGKVIKKDSVELIIEFHPTEAKFYNDNLKILNNSPDSVKTISLTGNSVSAEGGDLILSLINYPNPFHFGENTTIEFTLSQDTQAIVNIYDLSGQLVAKFKVEKTSTIQWDGLDYNNSRVAYGVYLCELIATAPGKEERRYRKIAITPK